MEFENGVRVMDIDQCNRNKYLHANKHTHKKLFNKTSEYIVMKHCHFTAVLAVVSFHTIEINEIHV